MITISRRTAATERNTEKSHRVTNQAWFGARLGSLNFANFIILPAFGRKKGRHETMASLGGSAGIAVVVVLQVFVGGSMCGQQRVITIWQVSGHLTFGGM